MSKNWYVLYTKPRMEKLVEINLTDKNIEAYLPKSKEKRQWKDRVKTFTAPLFQRYIFVQLTSLEMDIARWTSGVLKFVSMNQQPVKIAEKEIELIRNIENNFINVSINMGGFVVGQRVKVNRGVLFGQTGILVKIKGKKKVAIKMESMNCFMCVDLSPIDLIILN